MFLDDPELEMNAVYRWADWPERENLTGLDGKDIGIDLVGRLKSGEWVAIQCKCYTQDHRVEKKDIDSFLAVSGRDPFELRWIIATCNWSVNAETEIKGQKISVQRIDFQKYHDVPIDDPSSRQQHAQEARALWDIQNEAVENTVDGLTNYDRGQLIMACGTGKTFTSLRISERVVSDGGRILFLAPSIALVSQARREWLMYSNRQLRTLVVCSDSTAGRDSGEDIGISELACRVTTDPQKIARELDNADNEGVTCVIFSTYQSLQRVSEAQLSHLAPDFDLAVIDEAHRTTGVDHRSSAAESAGKKQSYFQLIHDKDALRSKKRLYMTATPRMYTIQSKTRLKSRGYDAIDMDDYGTYGHVFHRLTFKDAVEAGMLSDYRVIIMEANENDVTADLNNRIGVVASEELGPRQAFTIKDATRLLGTALAINGLARGVKEERPGVLTRVIGYANSISRSKTFAKALKLAELREAINPTVGSTAASVAFDAIDTADGASIGNSTRAKNPQADAAGNNNNNNSAVHIVSHLDASSSALERNLELSKLEKATAAEPRMLCNVRLFTEGVDVPSLDAVVFLDPRDSQVDVVQAVGRVMRKAHGKRFGYIIIPVSVPSGGNIFDVLESDSEGYETVGRVLRALQSHDGRLVEQPLKFVQVYSNDRKQTDTADPSCSAETAESGIQSILGLEDMSEKFYAKVIAASGLGSPGLLTSQNIEYVVKSAAGTFERAGVGEKMAAALDLPINDADMEGRRKDDGRDAGIREACTVAALLVANACLLHRRLVNVPHMLGLASLNGVGRSRDPNSILSEAWRAILKKDYSPIFEPALAVLASLPPKPVIDDAIKTIADCANSVADSLGTLGYDHAGPLYHRILEMATSDGAFYTNNVSALMLARLAISDDFTEWVHTDAVRSLRIMDPACGTGTLLMAALKTIKSRMNYENLNDASQIMIHRMLVEDCLCGLDINRHGIQLAACNLTLGAPTVDYDRMNLMTMRHGPQQQQQQQSQTTKTAAPNVKAGSLEILRASSGMGDTILEFIRGIHTMEDLQAEHVTKAAPTEFPLSGLDVVIMNPPFTDNTKRNRKFSPSVVKQMQANEIAIMRELKNRDPAAGKTIDMNSISTFFTPLADRLLDKQRGTLAKVMPVTACIGASGIEERKFLADRFHVERIVVSHDPKHPNFSHNTGIHECLMICRRSPHTQAAKPPTEFVSLRRMPKTAKEAEAAADAISSGSPGEWGISRNWPSERISAGDWSPVQWSDAGLAGAVLELESSELLEPVGVRHEIGPAGQRIHDAYEKCDQNDDGSVMIFDSISSKLRRTIHSAPESWHRPKRGEREKRLATIYWKQRSILLVAKKMDTISGRLTALYSDEATVGKGWTPVSVGGERTAKALAVWWNSTPARMMLLNRRSKKLTYPQWSLAHLKEIRIPKPGNPAWDALAETYDKVCDEEISPMSNADHPVRVMIDEAASKALNIDPAQLAKWREQLSREPTVQKSSR